MNEEIAKLIEEIFSTQWALKTSPPAVKYNNVPFRQPANGELITMTIVPGSEQQMSMGDEKVERQLGVVVFQIFTPKNIGDRRAKQIADLIAGVFRFRQFVLWSDNTITTLANGKVITLAQAGFLLTEGLDILTTEDGQRILLEGADTLPKTTILFRAPYPRDVGERSVYYQLNFIVPFQADRLFS